MCREAPASFERQVWATLSDLVRGRAARLGHMLRGQRVFQEFKPEVPIARVPTESVKTAAQACAEAQKLRNRATDSKELHRWEANLENCTCRVPR